MARQVRRISDLPEAGPLAGDELIEIVQDGDNKRVTVDDLPGGAVQSVQGRTGDVVITADDVGLGNADNTSDANKPVSTAQQAALDAKVDKVAGKGLSTNDFTGPLREKLIGLEGTHWRGTFVSLAALQAGVTDPEAGDYADVDNVGADVERYIWDATDSVWVVQSGAVAPVTAAQVKQLYESNPDTNAFTNADESKLGGIEAGATANSADAYLLKRANHTGTQAISTVTGLQDELDDRVLNNDSRLTNSREWTATTVSQAEAEAGTATTRRAWTAQRVRQAIAAWWDSTASTSGKTVATGTPAQARTALDVPSTTSLKQASPSILIVDQLRASVEAASGGRMTVLYTASGQPSYMHVFPAFNLEDVAPGGELGTGLHPAFLFDGQPASEIFIGAYQASTPQSGGAAVSLPGVDLRASINFDSARDLCKANGPGWDMMSNLDWAAIALWCMANGFEPRGNTNYGRSHEDRWETGRRQDGGIPGEASGTARTLTGSGPAAWAHDGTPAGIHDLVGNVWEWVSGMKLVDGRAWIAPDNGQTEEAQYIDSGFDMTDANPWSGHPSEGASDLVKQSLLAPTSPALSPAGRLYVNAEGERLPRRGGAWSNASNAGLAALRLTNARTYSNTSLGFRPRFRAQ